MRNVYLIQPNNTLSDSLFLPYAVGTIAAYSFQKDSIKNNYRLCDFVIAKTPIEEVISQMEAPFIAGFSSYMWNIEYNLALAAAIKENWPECIVAFGGPQIPDDADYLEKYSFIDLLMHGEGEKTFYSVLTALIENEALSTIPNISCRTENGPIQTEKLLYNCLEEFPSPYTMGLFDKIVNDAKYKNIQFDAILETNRGCPYRCIYCCWAADENVFRQFPMERIKGDLDWMAEHKITYCMCGDSNFGILDRDEEIAEYIVKLKKEQGYPKRFETTAAKNKDELTFRINKKLDEVDLNRGISVAVQSMSPKVLEIIGRKNMSVNNFSTQLKRYRQNGMYTYTDIILGLPGETLESFCEGLYAVIEAGQHSSINIYRCEFLPNTIMYSKEMVEKYRIKTIRSYMCQNHSPVVDGVRFGSRSEVVVETSTMSVNDWRKAFRISVCTQGFHCMGMLRFFAIYLRKAKQISYYEFYMALYEWIETKSVTVKRIVDTVCSSVDTFLKKESNLSFSDKRFGNIYWDFDEGLFLCCAAELDAFYEEIKNYLQEYFEDEFLFKDLFRYQKEIIALPSRKEKELITEYDWHSYFERLFDETITVPEKKTTKTIVGHSGTETWEDYAREVVWYGKRSDKMIKTKTE